MQSMKLERNYTKCFKRGVQVQIIKKKKAGEVLLNQCGRSGLFIRFRRQEPEGLMVPMQDGYTAVKLCSCVGRWSLHSKSCEFYLLGEGSYFPVDTSKPKVVNAEICTGMLPLSMTSSLRLNSLADRGVSPAISSDRVLVRS